MKFSIIIPMRNNRADLIALLKTLEQQSYPEPFETIVVDQSEVKEDAVRGARGPCQWFTMEGSGAARSRNRALKHAHGDYLVWVDANARFKIDTLQTLAQIIQDHPHYDVICGRCLNIEDGKAYSRYSRGTPQAVDFQNYDCCLASAMALKRTLLSTVGLLDERLGTGAHFGGSEESDWVLRVLEHGGKVLYHPRLDPRSMSLRAWLRRHYRYGMGRGAMLRKRLSAKPRWVLWQLVLALLKPAAGVLGELLRLHGRQAARYAASIVGRLWGFVSYRP